MGECHRFSGHTDFYSMGRKSEIEKAPRLTIEVPMLAKVTLQHLKVGWPAAYWHRGWRQPRPSPLGRSGVGLLLFLLFHSLSLSPATSFPWWRPLNFFSLNICVLLPTAGRSAEDPQENGKSVHEFCMQLNERRLK